MSSQIFNTLRINLFQPQHSSTASTTRRTTTHILTQIRTATKKAGGSTNNGRDSAGRRLGIKAHANMMVNAGSIIARQRGKKWYPGENVGMGKDHTLFAKKNGVVNFSPHPWKKKKVVNIIVAA
jgi:large subunit ribosomal protein L27